jgi:hypothetical protein
MDRRLVAPLLVAFLAADAAVAMAACSSASPGVDPPDATTETPDAGKDAPVEDGGGDGGKSGGHCTPVRGPCDLVLQDCPDDDKGNKQECVVPGTTTTACVPVQASQQLPIGRGCCPNNATGNPCLPGLTCVGAPCEDGGTATGRCSPACCTGDDQACGKSDPEGFSGACDLTLVDDPVKKTPLYAVCTYRQRCKPFNQEPCKEGQTCIVEDYLGTGTCLDSFGKKNRDSCMFANDCEDGLMCMGSGASGTCRTVCLLPNTASPFDPSIGDAGAGEGGCPPDEVCKLSFVNRPAWFGVCAFADGGG